MHLKHGMVCVNATVCLFSRAECQKCHGRPGSTRSAYSNFIVLSRLTSLSGLQSFNLMRSAGCLSDQPTNSYCFVEAAHSTNPSDLFYYQLPLGISLPNNTTPSCSSCAKSLLSLYAQALQSASKGTLADLQKTYLSGEEVAVAQCGAGYAEASAVTGGAVGRQIWHAGVSLTAILLTWVVLLLAP